MNQDRAAAIQSIARIRAENEAFYSSDRGHGSLRDLQQTFPQPWLYVGELLQNAVDAGAQRIRLLIAAESSSLTVEHDGAVFTERNVEELSARGISTKGAGTVGFMGIGFKAVFQSYESVDVSSGPWRFRFCVKEEVGEYGDRQRDWLGCVLPQYVAEIPDPTPGMTCRFVLHGRLDKLGPIHVDVINVLSNDLLVLALLARRGLKEFEWDAERWLLSQSEERIDEHTTRILLESLNEATGQVRQWVLFSATYQPSSEAIARFLEHRQIRPNPQTKERVYAEARRERSVDMFCPLNEECFPVPPPHGQAYALLGTGVTVPVGLHVQADWLLNTSRRELMEITDNAWHREILGRLASLIRAYLLWVTRIPDMSDQRLAEGYAVLPQWGDTEGAFATYVQDPQYRTALRESLVDLPFLPVRRSGGTDFATAAEARLLPRSLRGFEDATMSPWALFGDNIISTAALGKTAMQSLDGLELLRTLQAGELQSRWGSAGIASWLYGLGEEALRAHLKLLQALASLNNEPEWRDAHLRCLPTASGAWIDRHSALGLPANWDSVPAEHPPLRAWLSSFIPHSDVCLEWSFDRSIQRDPGAQQYLADLKRKKLEEVLTDWWAALPTITDEDTRTRILETTYWVMTKQRQQPGLIMRALCDDHIGKTVLVPLKDAVLADPYASRARRQFFPGYASVSACYLQHKPGYSDADWRSFFEEASKEVKGPFRLDQVVEELSAGQLQKALPNYKIPSTKGSRITARWGNRKFSSDNYLFIDVNLPTEVRAAITGVVQYLDANSIAAWLTEARQELAANATRRVAYVPYFQSSTSEERTGSPAAWVRILREARWVYSVDKTGPFTPDQVLGCVDSARPDAPVAYLPDELVVTLESCGVSFGSSLQDIASIERLQLEAPLAEVNRVLQLLEQAINDAIASGHREELRLVLEFCPLVVIPTSLRLIDRAVRVSATRLVQRAARGGALGGWLLPIDVTAEEVGEVDAHIRLLRLISSVYPVPIAPTWEQASEFLQWVWRTRPDAELVRRALPRAYRSVIDGLDGTRKVAWAESRVHATVYVSSRKWIGVTSDDLFLDDLGDDQIKGSVAGLGLATAGHLGETVEDQHQVAALLGVKPLSSRFQVTQLFDGERLLPANWSDPLNVIIELVRSYVGEDHESHAPPAPLTFVYCSRIRKSLVENGTAIAFWDAYATRKLDRVWLAGSPDDFAADLCRVLLQWAGLAGRRDLDELAPTMTQMIGWIDRPEKFSRRLALLNRRLSGPTSTATREPFPQKVVTAENIPTQEAAGATLKLAQSEELGPALTSAQAVTEGALGPVDDDVEALISSRYTAHDRENRLQALRKQGDEIDAQIQELLAVAALPLNNSAETVEDEHSKPFGSDLQYRQAALNHEALAGRYAEAKDARQPGYDIDSFDRPVEDPERMLVRRIEVKGHGCPWTNDDTVELSDRQFFDALAMKSEQMVVSDDFDYWLYVVERAREGGLRVLPIKNPASRAARFEFRGGTWRGLAEGGDGATQDE